MTSDDPWMKRMDHDQGLETILLEGTRNLSADRQRKASDFARAMASKRTETIFRSGHAAGADAAFAKDVCAADTQRLQLVLPFPGWRKKSLPPGATVCSLQQVPDSELHELARIAVEASPGIKRVVRRFVDTRERDRVTAKAFYLLRDVLKVVGSPWLELTPASSAVFAIDPDKPSGGGTGHTMRICQMYGVPMECGVV